MKSTRPAAAAAIARASRNSGVAGERGMASSTRADVLNATEASENAVCLTNRVSRVTATELVSSGTFGMS